MRAKIQTEKMSLFMDNRKHRVDKKVLETEPLPSRVVVTQNKKEMDIKNKLVVVTGVSKGIGFELLKRFYLGLAQHCQVR